MFLKEYIIFFVFNYMYVFMEDGLFFEEGIVSIVIEEYKIRSLDGILILFWIFLILFFILFLLNFG